MNPISNFLSNFLLYYTVAVIFTFMHELGHALPLLLYSDAYVSIKLGRQIGNEKKVFTIKRLAIYADFPFLLTGRIFYNSHKVCINDKVRMYCYAGGPLVSLLFLLIFFTAYRIFDYDIITFPSAAINGWLFISTVIPVVYPKCFGGLSGIPSDGLRIMKLLTQNNQNNRLI
ncbi:MAG: hypothetical protein ACOZCL_12450 [Bacillota bacterium]